MELEETRFYEGKVTVPGKTGGSFDWPVYVVQEPRANNQKRLLVTGRGVPVLQVHRLRQQAGCVGQPERSSL